MIGRISERMSVKSAALLLTIDDRLNVILKWWLLAAGLASALRIIAASQSMPVDSLSTLTSYTLVIVTPFISTLAALRWFSDGHLQTQSTTRLARVGRWESLTYDEAVSHPLYGTNGIMVSLLVGMMLNVPIRAAEYLAAMPAVPSAEPHWFAVLHFLMTADEVVFTSLYMIAFVAALRRVPLFPRLLLAIWLGDLAMQLVTAQIVSLTQLPTAVAAALDAMLVGNVKKVLISMALWLPYLLLSTRVNVTYRHRVPA